MTDDTIDGNTASGATGGGVDAGIGTVNVQDTIIAGNTAAGSPSDFYYTGGTVNDNGGNLLGTTAGDGGKFGAGTIVADPKLGPLVDNGGHVAGAPADSQIIPTMALLPGSPAFGKGVAAGAPTTDERGFGRPSKPSIGAYEPQYASNATPNQVFVENLFEVFLNRTADPGSLAAATSFLGGGGTPTALVQILQSGTEYLDEQAAGLYHRYLDRAPSAAEIGVVAGAMAGGLTPEQLAAILVGSPEFFGDYGGNNEAFVQATYATVLGRSAGSGEVAGWLQLVGNGAPRGSVAALFLSSQEYLTDLALLDFAAYLGRGPSPMDLANFVSAAKGGYPSPGLAAIALGGSYAVRT